MIDMTLNLPIIQKSFLENGDRDDYLNKLNNEINYLINDNNDCWGRLDTADDTWSTYPIAKDLLFNGEKFSKDVFDNISHNIKDAIFEYMMSIQISNPNIYLMYSSIYVYGTNPRKDFISDHSQHFTGYAFISAEENAGNLIIKNPIAPAKVFSNNNNSPLREYYFKQVNTGDLVILPSHIEHKMYDFKENNELRTVEFGILLS